MNLTPSKITWFTFFKLPAVYWSGIRVHQISETTCDVTVKFRWINQNPFKSMFWAVQGMAAELSTGSLVMQSLQRTGEPIAMLLIATKAEFHKKARGRIHFVCEDGVTIADAVQKCLSSGTGESFWLQSIGRDEAGDVVSEFHFQWSIKSRR